VPVSQYTNAELYRINPNYKVMCLPVRFKAFRNCGVVWNMHILLPKKRRG